MPCAVLLALLLVAITLTPVHAQDWAPTGATLTWENDLFAGTDRHYTNGLELTLFGRVPARAAPRFLGPDLEWRLTLGQQVFTPEELHDPEPILDDRPYAGWLYLGLDLVARSSAFERTHRLGVDLGVVGPAAGAADLQRFVHGELTQGVLPRGWRHQVANEPGLVLRYELDQRLLRGEVAGLNADLAARVGFELGNVRAGAWVGAMGRAGWGVPDPYAPGAPRALRVYLTASVDLHVVGHDLFVAGSLLRPGGVRVEQSRLVTRATLGLMIAFHDAVSLTYTHTLVTRQFTAQGGLDSFGALALTVSW
jgi:lipid A 3-O-deacylase